MNTKNGTRTKQKDNKRQQNTKKKCVHVCVKMIESESFEDNVFNDASDWLASLNVSQPTNAVSNATNNFAQSTNIPVSPNPTNITNNQNNQSFAFNDGNNNKKITQNQNQKQYSFDGSVFLFVFFCVFFF